MTEIDSQGMGQYLTFTLAEETFALGISTVREILDYSQITRIPRMPEFMRGVINLRGRAVPVLDLRLKFGLPASGTGQECIIVCEVGAGDDRVVLGAVADSVQEVLEIEPQDIMAPPRMGTSVSTEFMRGMARHGEGFIIILDGDRVFSLEELTAACAIENNNDAAVIGEPVNPDAGDSQQAAAGA